MASFLKRQGGVPVRPDIISKDGRLRYTFSYFTVPRQQYNQTGKIPVSYCTLYAPCSMSARITTPFGEAVPPAPRHSVTVHMGSWDTVKEYGADSSKVVPRFKNAYPRMRPHRDIAQVGRHHTTHHHQIYVTCGMCPLTSSRTPIVRI